MTVLESYATMVAEIEDEEVFDSHTVKSDGGVALLVAVISTDEEIDATDAATAFVEAQVTGTVMYGRSDSAIVTIVSTISATDIHTYAPDADTVTMTGVPSGSDVLNHGSRDADTITLTAVPSGLDDHSRSDQQTIYLISVISATDEHGLVPEAGTVTMTATVSGPDLPAKGYLDADTITLTGVVSGLDAKQTADADTITMTSVVSGTDIMSNLDAATITVHGTPSGVDVQGHWFNDAATVTMHGTASAVVNDDMVDTATVTYNVDQITAVDINAHWYADADTALVVSDDANIDDEYGTESGIFYEAVTPPGTDITIEYADPHAASQSLSVNVTGHAIKVNLATDGSGILISTDDDILALIQGDPSASALVNTTIVGTGLGIAPSFAPNNLTVV